MADAPEDRDQSKTEFLNRVKNVKSDIKTTFLKVRKELDDKELNILKRVEEIEREILENYERASISLKEINQLREHALATLKSNTTNTLLQKNLEMYDKEIEEIKNSTKIDYTIDLVWKMGQLDLSREICEVSLKLKNISNPITNPSIPDTSFQSYPHQNAPYRPFAPIIRNPYAPIIRNPYAPVNQSNPGYSNRYGDQYFVPTPRYPNSAVSNSPSYRIPAPDSYLFPLGKPDMENLLNKYISVKDKKSLAPSRETNFPPELHNLAKEIVMNNQQVYKILPVYDVIIHNLEKEKKVEAIKSGLYNLAKYPLCLFLDPDRPQFHQIRTFSGFFTYDIQGKIERFEPIIEAIGYQLDGQVYKLSQDKLNEAGFSDRLATIGCELLLIHEELSHFIEIGTNLPQTNPILHFKSQKHARFQTNQTPLMPLQHLASAFTQGASQGLYETQPSLPPRRHPDSGKQMEEIVYANKDEIIQHEQNRAQATQAYPPGDMGQRNMDHGFENQHYVDQRGQYHQGSMNRDHFSGPQQTPMSQHYTGDIGQTGGSRGFDKGPKEKGPFHEQGITGRASQYSGPQQTPMSQHYTGDIDQRSVDRGFERPQDQSPYYPGNMADQQPFIDEST